MANSSSTSSHCVIGPEISVRGSLVGEEDLLIEGRIEGTVSLTGHLTVALGGTVEANLEVQSIEVYGEVRGDISAEVSATIERGARVVGNVRAPRVIINDGAHFDGAVEMAVELPDDLGKRVHR